MDPKAEARLQSSVKDLVQKLGLGSNPKLYADTLKQNVSAHALTRVTVETAKRKLTERAPDKEKFTAKYDGLKTKYSNATQELDRFCCVLAKITDDKGLSQMLSRANTGDAVERGVAEEPKSAVLPLKEHDPELRTPSHKDHLPRTTPVAGPSTQKKDGSKSPFMSPTSLKQLEAVTTSDSASAQKLPPPSSTLGGANAPSGLFPVDALPAMPSWTVDRPFLTGEYLEVSATVRSYGVAGNKPASLSSLPRKTQEWVFVEDLLYALMGIEGKYIRVISLGANKGVQFTVDSDLDESLADLAKRVLPLCDYYAAIVRFVDAHSRYEYGLVHHAFSAALRSLLKEYLVLIAQLEHQFRQGNLSLQKLWFYVQPSMRTMDVLHRITTDAQNMRPRGCGLLNLLHSRTSMIGGDQLTKQLVTYLMERASAPYFEMLQKWIYCGKIEDKYHEFMIEEHQDVRKETLKVDFNNSYWEQRYTIRVEDPPAFLEQVAEKILTTGKYLTVIAECGREIQNPFFSDKFVYDTSDREYVKKIEQAHDYASRTLLDLLINEEQLIAKLRSIKHYFLLDRGDFCVHFMDSAEEELSKNVSEISRERLESLLELSIRTSVCVDDPYKENITCSLLKYSLVDQLLRIINVQFGDARREGAKFKPDPTENVALTGLEAFTIDYAVQWPLSLIISKKAMTKYQLIFRHLFYCRHVERQLCNTWLDHQTVKEFNLNRTFLLSHGLRQRMLHFLQNYQYIMMIEVMEPNSHILHEHLKTVKTLDEVLRYHNDFLDTCLKECMLTKPHLLKILTKLMKTCVIFADFTERFTKTLTLDEESSHDTLTNITVDPLIPKKSTAASAAAKRDAKAKNVMQKRKQKIQVASAHINKIISEDGHLRTIKRFEENFDKHLQDLLEALTLCSYTDSDPHLNNLCTRLDYNGFYNRSFQKKNAPA